MIEIKADTIYSAGELARMFRNDPHCDLQWSDVQAAYEIPEVLPGSGMFAGGMINDALACELPERETLATLQSEAADVAEQMQALEAANDRPAIGPETGTATQEAAKNGKKGRGNG